MKFLKEKSEALSKFSEFKTTVDKDFELKVKCLHSDNGGKYMSNAFLKNCDDNGISRQMICPNTPQQNGVLKGKCLILLLQAFPGCMKKSSSRVLG